MRWFEAGATLQCSMDHGLAFWLTAPTAGPPSGDGPIETPRRLEGEPKTCPWGHGVRGPAPLHGPGVHVDMGPWTIAQDTPLHRDDRELPCEQLDAKRRKWLELHDQETAHVVS